MKALFNSSYKNYFIFGLLLYITTAWFSVGFHHPDEHYQILEFSNYKLQKTTANELPWEFASQIRAALQPFITYFGIKTFNTIGIRDPFIITFIFRLIMALFSWLIICKLILLHLPNFITPQGKKTFVLLSLFLWFIPYISVRYSSETTSALSFLWALYFISKPPQSVKNENISFLIAGCLLALSFFFRFQLAFAIIGLFFWLWQIKKISLKNWLYLLASLVLTTFVCVCIDYWFYNQWILTAYNYFKVNILQNVAANYGVLPWWGYFKLFFETAVPPISLVLLFFLLKGIRVEKKHVYTFILIPFLVFHSIIGHKEIRFLFPMYFEFSFLVCMAIDFYIQKYSHSRYLNYVKYSYRFLVALNVLILCYRTFSPANENIPFLKFANNHFSSKNTILCQRQYLFKLTDSIHTNFYNPKRIKELLFNDEKEINNYIINSTDDSFIIFTNKVKLDTLLDDYKYKRIFTLYPEWILRFNINDWQSRANISSFYVLYKK